ncbi:hypothetical protein [Rhodoplanes sp. SY1]|uniref:hypothetical protein n=1 Tax=Rhodoplanes sp. SY1 TaxID=3166646 RepID=UPI0038B44484
MNIDRAVLDRLPPTARARVRQMQTQVEAARDILIGATNQLGELQHRRRKLGEQRAALEHGVGLGKHTRASPIPTDDAGPLRVRTGPAYSPPTSGEIAAALAPVDAELSRVVEDIARVEGRAELARASATRVRGLLGAIERWVAGVPADKELSEHRGGGSLATSPTRAREVTAELIETKRRRVRELLADLRQIDAAPYLSANVKARWRAQLDQLAERGRPNVFPSVERGEPIEFPEIAVSNHPAADKMVPDGFSFLVWAFRDHVAAKIDAEIDANADDAAALSDQARREKFREVLGDLLAAEREEETLVAAAKFDVDRRPDADPRAVLGLASDLPPPRRDLFHKSLAYDVSDQEA